jgi:VWFA-related protein
MRCIALLCALTSSAALGAQAPTPASVPATSGAAGTIRAGTQLVILDVSVTGADGRAVPHLKMGDFAILENGAAQKVDRFEEHLEPSTEAPMPKMPRLPPGTYTNFSFVPDDGPLNVILLDTLNTPMASQMVVRQKILAFLQTMKPNQHVAIFGLSTRLYLLQGFTSDPAVLRAALSGKHGDAKTSPLLADQLGTDSLSDQLTEAFGNVPGSEEVIANVQQFEAITGAEQLRNRVLLTLTAMNQLARYLNGLNGRKNLVWMSGSFPLNVLPDGDLPNPFAAAISMEDSFRETTNLLARSQVTVYPVDARGLFTAPMMDASIQGAKYGRNPTRLTKDMQTFFTNTADEHTTMQQMADATGGKAYVNTNDLSGSVDSAFHAGGNYYTLAYSPTDRNWNGKYRKIVVRTATGTKYTLNYRRGYYADDPYRKTLDNDSTAATKSAAASIDGLNAAMQRGAPDPTQIIFKALIVPVAGSADKLTEGSVAAAKTKPPYRTLDVYLAGNASDIEFQQQPDGTRISAMRFATVVYDRDGLPITLFSRNTRASLELADYQRMLQTGMQFHEQISVPLKGEYFLRVGMRDNFSGKVGAIEVPVSSIPSGSAK